ncbi:MAG TPA: penicillin-binding protein 2 [Candidatus Limnocylindrales bacterium]|nr:penicillin-binding protein 2 [Candidatus Limnocylindrales bacterium]
MLGRTDSRARAVLVLLVFVIVAGALGARLAYWQVMRRDDLAAMAVKQSSMTVTLPAKRGAIYDRSGTVVLATSVERDRLAATPKLLTPERRAAVAQTLIGLLGLQGDAAITLRNRMASEREYVVLARGLDAKMSDRIRELSVGKEPALSGLLLEPEQERLYPQPGGGPETSLAAHLLGFVNREGTGQYGVEQFYQERLAGTPRIVAAQKDAAGNAVPDSSTVLEQGAPGEDLLLTIDAGLQVAVEQELLSAWIADRAKRVSAVVLDPYTGEVYAYGSYPSYDANRYQEIGAKDPGRFVDPIVSTVYEPGSVFKMLTATAALGQGTVTLDTKIKDQGTLRLDGGRAHVDNADHKSMGTMKFKNAIAYSRNVVAAKVAMKLGKSTREASTRLFDVWRKMGFGSPTGIDVSNEVSGLVRDPAKQAWRQIDLANGAFGQGIAVTPIQLAQAYAAMVNGGMLVQPRVVRQVGSKETASISRGRVVSPTLSTTLQALLRNVVKKVPFYRDRTLIPGLTVGGKTGTAQIWDAEKKAWKVNRFNYSFVGFIAREKDHPDLVVAVRIEEGTPTVVRLGHLEMPVMSFELFRRIAHDAISTPDLVPDERQGPAPVTTTTTSTTTTSTSTTSTPTATGHP